MARRIQLRRDTAANWSATNPTLAQGEIGFDLTNNKIKIGTGSTAWNSLPYFDDKETVLSNYAGHIVPSADNTYDLGAPDKQWRHVYTAGGSIYLDNIKLTNVNGKFTATKVINPGEENEEEDPEDSDATSEIRGGSIAVGDGQGPSVENVTEILINGTITEIEPGLVGISVNGEGLPTVTIPAEQGLTYKGLQVAYGMVHSNGSSSELNVNKIVIHKPAVAAVDIDPTSDQDYFQVSGIGSSDVLAMFVVYGDANGPKPLSTLQAFAEAAIDNVILEAGVEGAFLTVDEMKQAFANNYQILASAADGLYTNFEFFQTNVNTLDGSTTVREGSGASFVLSDASPAPGYTLMSIPTGGTNYLPGHKIKILGTDLGGTTPENDAIITVTTVNEGVITGAFAEGTAFATAPVLGWTVTGTNYNVGSGYTVASVSTNNGQLQVSLNSIGFNYVVGDVITLTGDKLQNGVTPDNDITITVTYVDGLGQANNSTVTGTLPEIWPSNNISDGGQDQYDTANYISTNFATEINYNSGETVVEGTAFGIGSTYSFAYETGIFGVFATNANVDYIRTNGNSGADGGSVTEAGHIYGPNTAAETFDNAVTHINIIGEPWAGPIVSFTKTDNGDEVDIIVPDDGSQGGIGITRDGNNGIYNPYRDINGWDSGISPSGTLWNIDGWADLSNLTSRTYAPLYEAFGSGGLGNKIVGTECVMLIIDTGKYYAVKFEQWTQGQNGGGPGGGGFSYTRREIDLTKLQEGVRFADGTRLKSAEGLGRVKLESPGNRRIEEVYGYKSVSVTSRDRQEITGATYTNVNAYELRIKKTTEIDAFISPYYNTSTTATWYISFDNVTFREATINSDGGDNWMFYYVNANNPTVQVEDAPFYIRRDVGGNPVVWWDSADLPGGGTNFRGAIIKYHAYITDAGSMVGTIHIAKDSGDENVFHTEVLSGGTDGENAVLWYQDNENQLKYQRIDGESSTAKIQWSATVFYGSEVWD